jgi:hypothetical protein
VRVGGPAAATAAAAATHSAVRRMAGVAGTRYEGY